MTRLLNIGNKVIGGGNRVLIQSMTNTKTYDIDATIEQINKLEIAGCDIVRVAVLNTKCAHAIKEIKKGINIPLVADIHYDYKLAVSCIYMGADKIRINPGNIGGEENVKYLVDVLKEKNIPIRIGVNSGSIDKDISNEYGNSAEALVKSAIKHIHIVEKYDYHNICVSVKASSVLKTIEAYTMLSGLVDYPLHLGVTEAGVYRQGLVKSAIGIGNLLLKGIGDTIRVSLAGDPIREIYAAKDILSAVELNSDCVEVIACPTCGRTQIDVESLAESVITATGHIKRKLKIAVMGCVVNGLGESAEADIGIAGGKDKSILFVKGESVKTVENSNILQELLEHIEKI